MLKKCNKCGQIKCIDEFYWRKKDFRLESRCKVCVRKYSIEHRANNIERYREYDKIRSRHPNRIGGDKKYRRSDVGRAAKRRNSKKFRKKRSEQYVARQAISNALRHGKIERQNCEVCGLENAQAHHPDYSQPFLVRWLCREHHLEVHGCRPRM